ncbi:MAG: hypothetical protein CVV53_00990 [Spirochaetae bacterium HGW-Spirochaetae-9]|nr:MAG: hypothetical protein CVV53_00990 [Spirochaetae bacterium HGW-Spirochaetae-9]
MTDSIRRIEKLESEIHAEMKPLSPGLIKLIESITGKEMSEEARLRPERQDGVVLSPDLEAWIQEIIAWDEPSQSQSAPAPTVETKPDPATKIQSMDIASSRILQALIKYAPAAAREITFADADKLQGEIEDILKS